MKEFEQAKKEYDNITIPKELSERIMLEVEHAEKKRKKQEKQGKMVSFKKFGAVAAIVTVTFVSGLNISPVFAREMANMPMIGGLAKVLTFREYEENTEDYVITVEIPTIEMISEDFSDLEEAVNAEIYALCEQYAQESKENAMQYREAFLETGGTLEEWKEHDIKIKVSYTIHLQTEEYLSLLVKRTESWNSASAEEQLFNINLKTGEQISSEELMTETDTVYYEDNFSVEIEAAVSQAEKIKEAVTNKDLEKLADFTAYPVYVGFAEEGLVVESRDEFIALGAERIFTEDFVTSITNTDMNNLSAGRAGFFMSAGDAFPSITFGVVDGKLRITGINY